MRCKEGVTLFGVKPEMVIALSIINEVYKEVVGQGVTITAVTDGKHKGHQHSLGYAIDCRTRDDDSITQWSNATKQKLARKIRERLTDEFDVVVHSTHIHVEFDIR